MAMKSLSEKSWTSQSIEEVFSISPGKRLESRNRIPGTRPFIGALDNSNGVAGFVANNNSSVDRNVLGVNYNGNGMGIGFYHPYECIFSDDVKRFHLKSVDDSAELALFTKTLIGMQRNKFGYLYKFNAKRMAATHILLPATDSGEPDYEFMAEYVKKKREELLQRYRTYIEKRIKELGESVPIPPLNEKSWSKFAAFGDSGLFDISTTNSSIDGVRIIKGKDDTIPYVTRTDSNNGIARFVSPANLQFGFDHAGCITVGLDTQTAYWQPYRFVTGQNILVITGAELDFYLAQFLIPLFKSQMVAKFNWGGNGATLGRMQRLELMLPVSDIGEPDLAYMRQYSRNNLLKKYRQYQQYLTSHE